MRSEIRQGDPPQACALQIGSGRRMVRLSFVAMIATLLVWLVPALAAASPSPAPTPVNSSAPTLTGTPALGQTLTCSTGTWSNNPSGYTYTWLRDGSAIAGQASSMYVVQSADQAHSISCQVTASAEAGGYTISSLPSGSYKISFSTESEGGNYLKQFFNGKPTLGEADPVAVTAPNATGGVDAQLHAGGQISGRVTDAISKAPIGAAFVCAEQISAKPEFGGCEVANGNGEYSIPGLQTGSYDVVFYAFGASGAYHLRFYNGKANVGEADPVAVTAGATTSGINAELSPYNEGAAIEGVVTERKLPHSPLSSIEVCASQPNEGFIGECTTTDASGKYKLAGLGAGEYIVTFSGAACQQAGCKSPNYIREYYEDKYASANAKKLTLVANKTETGVNAEMAKGGEVTGVVEDAATKAQLRDVRVCAYASLPVSGETEVFISCALSGPAGEYTLAGLPSGSYPIYASPAAGANYVVYSSNVTVNAEAQVTQNIALQAGGQITGRVTDASTHAPIAGVEVCASGSCATTGVSGEYTLSRLTSGTYEVSFFVESEKLNYLPQTRGGVVVKQGETTSAIDAELSAGGQIMGRVTDAVTHAGLTHINVCAEGIGGSKAFQCASSAGPGASATASSNALAVPAPNSTFKLVKKVFDAKHGNLDFFFQVVNAGTFKWSLFFEAAKKKCKAGHAKHKRKCGRMKVRFGSGSQSVPAGTVEIKVHASAKALKVLRTTHTLHVGGVFSFQSALGGSASGRTVSAVAHLPKKKRKRHKK